MEQRTGWMAGLGAAVVAGAVFFAHQAGLILDDAARQVPRAGRAAGVGGVADALNDPAISSAVKQGVATFRDLRNGTDEEVAVVKAGCAVMNAGVTGTGDQASYERQIRARLSVEYTQGPLSFLIDRYVDRASNALAIANANGGAARWYVQYCLFKP